MKLFYAHSLAFSLLILQPINNLFIFMIPFIFGYMVLSLRNMSIALLFPSTTCLDMLRLRSFIVHMHIVYTWLCVYLLY